MKLAGSHSPTPSRATLPAYQWSMEPVSAATVPHSWRPGCPVPLASLRLLNLAYVGFDGAVHRGRLVVNASAVQALASAFRELYDARFPIRSMTPIDAYDGNDDVSAAADNTSAFNCRNAVSQGPPHWSQHAYGFAVDVNPLENPYFEGSRVIPPAGFAYRNRAEHRTGMAFAGGRLVRALARQGWAWGGTWSHPDYQHFSRNGR